MPARLVAKAVELKNTLAACLLGVGLVTGLVTTLRIPSKLDAHMKQADAIVTALNETNRLLKQNVCITGRLDTVAKCLRP